MTGGAGSALLVRQHLRRDRVLVPVWIGALVLMAYASASATESLFGTLEDRLRIATLLNDQAALVALYGPILDPTSVGELAMSKLTVLYALFSCILYVVVVRRHTRVEEESGRAELVAGTSIGRGAPLAAAVAEGAGVALVLGALVAVADVAGGLPVAGSLWFGVAWAGTGLVATGTAAVACQLSASARTAGAVAAAILVGAFVTRALGDAVGRLHWLSWFSPLGWNTQLRAWTDPRWWVSALYVGLATALVLLAGALRARRDLGAGLVEARPGPTSGTMAGPWTLTLRLHRTSLVLWTVGAAGMSLLFGAMAPGFEDLLSTGGGRVLVDRLGGAFVAVLLPIAAMAITAFPVTVVGRACRDEAEGRLELTLAAGTSRTRWFAAPAVLGALGSAWLLAVCGTGLWAGYRLAGGVATTPTLAAALGWAPAVWVVLGVALVGLALRAGWLGWAALVGFVTLTLVGELLQLPAWLVRLSPYSALPAYPVAAWDWTPFLVLLVVGPGLTAVAGWWFARRDVR